MKKVNIEAFGEGQQVWFNIGRLKKVEEKLKKPIGEVLQDADQLNLTNMLVLLQAGMSQNGDKSEQYYSNKIDEALEKGFSIVDIQLALVKAVAGSGLLGQGFYYQMFPEELTEEKIKEINAEKN